MTKKNLQAKVESITTKDFPIVAVTIKVLNPAKEGVGSKVKKNDKLVLLPQMKVDSAHAIEGYVSVKAHPLTDTLALEAIRLIAANLRQAWSDGGNIASHIRFSDRHAHNRLPFGEQGQVFLFCSSLP
jgi:hypothetical protein